MAEPEIKTKVVGSYPIPSWLSTNPSTPTLRDAIMVVLKTQELAGIDLISDGELSRFDVSHPQTNGMIDYFIRPMGGISSTITARTWPISPPSSEWAFAPSRPEWWRVPSRRER